MPTPLKRFEINCDMFNLFRLFCVSLDEFIVCRISIINANPNLTLFIVTVVMLLFKNIIEKRKDHSLSTFWAFPVLLHTPNPLCCLKHSNRNITKKSLFSMTMTNSVILKRTSMKWSESAKRYCFRVALITANINESMVYILVSSMQLFNI